MFRLVFRRVSHFIGNYGIPIIGNVGEKYTISYERFAESVFSLLMVKKKKKKKRIK